MCKSQKLCISVYLRTHSGTRAPAYMLFAQQPRRDHMFSFFAHFRNTNFCFMPCNCKLSQRNGMAFCMACTHKSMCENCVIRTKDSTVSIQCNECSVQCNAMKVKIICVLAQHSIKFCAQLYANKRTRTRCTVVY